MTAITAMEAYATTDGKLFTDPIEAKAHQHGLDIHSNVEKYLGESYKYSFSGFNELRAIINWEIHKKLEELKGTAK